MKIYNAGKAAALTKLGFNFSQAQDQNPYESSGVVGGLAGAAGGAGAGGALGHAIAQHIGKLSRTRMLGMGIPGTGYGEAIFGTPKGPMAGELLGSLAGGAVGGTMGYHGGHLAESYRRPPSRHLTSAGGGIDPALLSYLMGK